MIGRLRNFTAKEDREAGTELRLVAPSNARPLPPAAAGPSPASLLICCTGFAFRSTTCGAFVRQLKITETLRRSAMSCTKPTKARKTTKTSFVVAASPRGKQCEQHSPITQFRRQHRSPGLPRARRWSRCVLSRRARSEDSIRNGANLFGLPTVLLMNSSKRC